MTELDIKDSGLNYLQIDSHFLARSSGWKQVGSSCGDNIHNQTVHNIHIMFPQKSPLIYIFMVHVVLYGTLLKIFLKIRHFFSYLHKTSFLSVQNVLKKRKKIYMCSITKLASQTQVIYWQNSAHIMFAHDKQCTAFLQSKTFLPIEYTV